MWWFAMIIVIVILALFGEFKFENNWNHFLFEIRLKSAWPRFNIPVLKIYEKRW